MRQQNSVDNGLIFAYDIARHLRASRKPGLGHLPGCLLTIAVLLLLQGVMCPAGYAGNFPGKGSRQAWLRANAFYNHGIDLKKSGRYSEAAVCSKRAIEIYPYDCHYYALLGQAYDGLKEFKKAEAAYRTAISLNPGDWGNWYDLVDNLYDQGKYKESEMACIKALGLSPPAEKRAKLIKALNTLKAKTGSLVGAQP